MILTNKMSITNFWNHLIKEGCDSKDIRCDYLKMEINTDAERAT